MNLSSKNIAAALSDIFLAPSNLFSALPSHRSWAWAALALLIAVQIASIYAFFGPMSPEWIVEQQLAVAGLSANEAEAARPTLMAMAPNIAHISAASSVMMVGLFPALLALVYFLGERLLSGSRQSYGSWFSISVWAQMPMLLNALGLIVLSLLAASPDQPLAVANYASLNGLILDLPLGHPWYNWAQAFSVFFIWSSVLIAIAVRVAQPIAWGRALLLGALPYVLVFGVWAVLV
jgi:hypothetical protein